MIQFSQGAKGGLGPFPPVRASQRGRLGPPEGGWSGARRMSESPAVAFFPELPRNALKCHDSWVNKQRNSGAERLLNEAERRLSARRTGVECARNAALKLRPPPCTTASGSRRRPPRPRRPPSPRSARDAAT